MWKWGLFLYQIYIIGTTHVKAQNFPSFFYLKVQNFHHLSICSISTYECTGMINSRTWALFFAITLFKHLAKTIQGRKGWFWLMVWGSIVPYGGEGMAKSVRHCIFSKEVERKKLRMNLAGVHLFIFCIRSGTTAHGIALNSLRVGLLSLTKPLQKHIHMYA